MIFNMLSDIEIAQGAKMKPIIEIAENMGIGSEDVEPTVTTRQSFPRRCTQSLLTSRTESLSLLQL